MKKTLLLLISLLFFFTIIWNFTRQTKNTQLSDLTLANIEALANGEDIFDKMFVPSIIGLIVKFTIQTAN